MEDQTPGRGYALGRVAFKAHSEAIRKEVEAGYPLTTVFNTYKDRLGITYSQFRRHVNRYILNQIPVKPSPQQEAEEKPKPEKAQSDTNKASTAFSKNFEFNPVAPDYGDLV
jgi:hypothetical protein